MIGRINEHGTIEVMRRPATDRTSQPGIPARGDVVGCGSVNLRPPDQGDDDRCIDCLDCGIFFVPEQGEWKPLVSYHFSLGNSSNGPVGYCARVRATSAEQAVTILKARLPEESACNASDDGCQVEYIRAYFNGQAISAADIDEENPITPDDLTPSELEAMGITQPAATAVKEASRP